MDKITQQERVVQSELLIAELYLDLRRSVNKWSLITQQTPQARMGYVGQHLVSIVTGYPGGKSGARGYDLIIPSDSGKTEYGEIKTCYRVDQLGSCLSCKAKVSSLETVCSSCDSEDIKRNDDSKWLLDIRTPAELNNVFVPKFYYFVLFEFEEITKIDNNNIIATIWKVNPKVPGFTLGMLDYYYNIKAKSNSAAPFNVWPHMLKFFLMRPIKIYESRIKNDNTIETLLLNSDSAVEDALFLPNFARAKISLATIQDFCTRIKYAFDPARNAKELLSSVQSHINKSNLNSSYIADEFSKSMYLQRIQDNIETLPFAVKSLISTF